MRKIYAIFLMILLPLVVVSFTSCSSSSSEPNPVEEAMIEALVGEYDCTVGESNETVKMTIVRGKGSRVNIALPKVFEGKVLVYSNLRIDGAELGGTLSSINVLYKGDANAEPITDNLPASNIKADLNGIVSTGKKINFTIKLTEEGSTKTITVVNKVSKTALVEAVIGEYKSTAGSLEPVMVSVVKGAENQVNITLPKVFVDDALAYENFKIVGVDVDDPVTAVKMSFKGEATADGEKKAQTEVSGTIAAGQIDLTIKIGEGAAAKTVLVKNKVYLIEEITSLSVGKYTSLINGKVFAMDESGQPDPEQTVIITDNPATVVLTPSAGQTSKVDFDLQGFEFSGIAIPVNLTEVALVKEGEKGARIDFAGQTTVDIGMGSPMPLDITIKGTIIDGVMDLALEIDVAEGAIKGSIIIKGDKTVE